MSLLSPGGLRSAPFGRIFGFEAIRQHIAKHKRDHRARGANSIATGNRWGGAHQHQREIARHRRQQKGPSA